MKVQRLRVACLGMLALIACGCTTLPVSGGVHTRDAGSDASTNEAPFFEPPGPTTDDTPAGIVRGFLLAMQASPPSIAVARDFLSDHAKDTWKPNQGTIVYDAATVDAAGDQVTARLRGAHRLSPDGAWLGGTDATTAAVPLTLVQEGGQWRIDNPPNVLAVPASYFSCLFLGFDLYFFDRTGTVLVPTKVYVPVGEQTATNLVRGLLDGPPPALRDVAVSAFPAGLDLDLLAVVVNDAGIAEIPLGADVLDLAPSDLNRIVAQLAWTLRQVPGITRLQLTVDGSPVTLADGRTDVNVSAGAEYDPLAVPQRELLAISGGRVVQDDGTDVTPADGPFGEAGFALRSLAWSTHDHTIAAVGESGRRVFVAPDRGTRSADRVHAVLNGGTDVLRPTYDRFGQLWIMDVTSAGAVVHQQTDRQDRIVHVEGISGRQVSAFTVTRDGSTLVAVLGTGTSPIVEVSNLVRDADGRVLRATTARTLLVGGADLGPARDVAQNSATTVAVLTGLAGGPDHIVYVELDGSPGPEATRVSAAPETVPGELGGLVASSDPALPLRVLTTDQRLFAFSEGRWMRAAMSDVAGATYAQ